MSSWLGMFSANILHFAPIVAVGFFGLAIILERVQALVFIYPMKKMSAFLEKIRDLLMADRVAEAISLCDEYDKKPAAHVMKEALLRAHQPEDLIEEGIELAVSESEQKIQMRTGYLATIANVSTLLGLFGTILGLIHSFEAVGSANPQQRSALLALGISTAMNATMMGLAVAIPCMVAYSYLMTQIVFLNTQVEQTAIRMLDMIKQRYYDADIEPFRKGRDA